MGGEGFCRGCIRGELIAIRSRTVHEPDDRELLRLPIRGTAGGALILIWSEAALRLSVRIAGCMQVRLFDGMWGLLIW